MRLHAVALIAVLLMCVLPASADSFGVQAEAETQGNAWDNCFGWGCLQAPAFHSETTWGSEGPYSYTNGLNHASLLVSTPFSNNDSSADPVSSVSVSVGHIAMALSVDATNTGTGSSYGYGGWGDMLHITSDTLPYGTPVWLDPTLALNADLIGTGLGSSQVSAHFVGYGYWDLSTSGSFTSSDDYPSLPPTQSTRFLYYVGGYIQMYGQMTGSASANPDQGDSGDASWSMLSSNSGHFSITSETAGVQLEVVSGCDITNGYGCDSVPSNSVPEPASCMLLLAGLAGLGTLRKVRK